MKVERKKGGTLGLEVKKEEKAGHRSRCLFFWFFFHSSVATWEAQDPLFVEFSGDVKLRHRRGLHLQNLQAHFLAEEATTTILGSPGGLVNAWLPFSFLAASGWKRGVPHVDVAGETALSVPEGDRSLVEQI